MFERTLQDLIRGLRAHKASSKAQEDAFLAEAMVEIRDELKGKDMALKAEGILKMCYLMMLYPLPPPNGFAFHVVEVMSSPRYHLKQLGYMAAPMAFSGDTEEVVLTVNGIKKDLLSPHAPLPPLPLSSLPHLLALSPSLSLALHTDLLHLLTHSSPRIRKRAVLCLLPCWEAYPEGLKEGFSRLREKLQDEDLGVVGATVGVVMELARRQGGQMYLPLAPDLFGILTGSSNNWMLIKVVKLFAILTPLEPRLVRKLLPPLTSLISSTSAISLLYECVRTCIVGGMLDPDRPEGEALAKVCVEKLGGYLRDEGGDQNLRYIALLAMVKIIPTHPHMVVEYQEEILQSLEDPDVSIRMRALELVTSMVNRDNLQYIVDQLLTHLAPPEKAPLPSAAASLAALSGAQSTSDPSATAQSISLSPAYRLLLAQRLLAIIAQDTFVHVTDFEWAVSVLVDVAYVSRVDVGERIRALMLDICGRVKSVRPYAVIVLEKVVGDEDFRERGRDKTGEDGLLEAAIWICGEYASELSSPLSAISNLLSPTLHLSSPYLIALSLHTTAKVFGHHAASISSRWSADLHEETQHLVASIKTGLTPFIASPEIEVQERAFELTQLFSFVDADLRNHVPPSKPSASAVPDVHGGFEAEPSNGAADPPYPKSLFLFRPLFMSHELNSVAARAQEAVRIPDGLNLDIDIVPASSLGVKDDEGSEREETQVVDLGEGGGEGMEELRRLLRDQEKRRRKKKSEMTEEGLAERAKRKAARRERLKNDPYYLGEKDDVDDIPVVRLDDAELAAPSKPKSIRKKTRPASTAPPPEIDRAGEMPEGASLPPPTASSSRTSSPLPPVQPAKAAGRYEEYTLDEKDDTAARDVEETPATSTTPSTPVEQQSNQQNGIAEGDVPVAEVEVVKVRRREGEKRKKKKVVAA
ncbi:AP-3 complex subunit delta [Cryptotrichosporon argae]